MGYMVSNADKTFNVTVGNTKGLKGNGAPNYVQYGYGQVEPNHLSAQKTGQIFAQLPVASDINLVQNGQFMKYDYAKGVCNFDGDGEWMLVFNEVKVYHDRDTDADFAMKKEDYIASVYDATGKAMPEGTVMVPRLFKTNPGDHFTTNAIVSKDEEAFSDVKVGAKLTPNAQGFLEINETPEDAEMVWQIVKVYTMPDDRQRGVKVMRIK